MKKIKILAPAKINLYLKVMGKERDGYHRVDTVFQAVDLYDEVTVSCSNRAPGIRVTCRAAGGRLIEELCGEKNIVFRAAEMVATEKGIKKGIRIEIRKRIPVGAGMGGGSSDAAAALKGMNRLFELKMTLREMLSFAGRLGADVPFFLFGGTARGTGYGDVIKPLPGIKNRWFLIVNPGFSIDTRRVYEKYDGFDGKAVYLRSGYFMKEIGKYMINDLQPVVAESHPEIEAIIEFLKKSGACTAMMTGSGSTVFSPLSDRAQGVLLKKELERSFEKCSAWLARSCGVRHGRMRV